MRSMFRAKGYVFVEDSVKPRRMGEPVKIRNNFQYIEESHTRLCYAIAELRKRKLDVPSELLRDRDLMENHLSEFEDLVAILKNSADSSREKDAAAIFEHLIGEGWTPPPDTFLFEGDKVI